MWTALKTPSFPRTFPWAPGARSRPGPLLSTSVPWPTGMSWAPATRTNAKPASSASTERLGDDLAERLRRVRAHEHAAVDEERRRALDSQGARLLQVGLHGGGEGASVQAAGEALPVDRKVDRVADQVFPLEPRLLLEEAVLGSPVRPLDA